MASGDRNEVPIQPLIDTVKLFADGHEEKVRNLLITGLTLKSFKDIVAVSNSPYVYTARTRIGGRIRVEPAERFQPGGPSEVSVVAPAILFEDMTLVLPSGDVPNLPFSRNPYFDK
jgi:hypothetical protein